MKRLLAACVLFGSCASVPPGEGFHSCDATAAGDFDSRIATSGLTRDDVNRGVRAALNAATFTTDPNLNDQTENCRALMGYRIYTRPSAYTQDGQLVAGHTQCFGKYIVVATPEMGGSWRESALVHELMHAMQHCTATPPMDPGMTYGHDNWIRHGIYPAVDAARTEP
jgi:hypothetical protein